MATQNAQEDVQRPYDVTICPYCKGWTDALQHADFRSRPNADPNIDEREYTWGEDNPWVDESDAMFGACDEYCDCGGSMKEDVNDMLDDDHRDWGNPQDRDWFDLLADDGSSIVKHSSAEFGARVERGHEIGGHIHIHGEDWAECVDGALAWLNS